MSKVQAVLFQKERWKPEDTVDWLLDHGFLPIKKIHETKRYYRFRLRKPGGTMRTKKITDSIKFIIQF